MIGRLNHTAAIIPLSRHFLGRLRFALCRASAYRCTRLTAAEKHDLHWWKRLLDLAVHGVNLNLLVFREPNQITLSDACNYGISGFSVNSGRAWRFYIPPHLRGKRHINFLEFLGNVITILLEIYEGRVRPGDCFLSIGDNTSAAGWLMKSNFSGEDKVAHAALALPCLHHIG